MVLRGVRGADGEWLVEVMLVPMEFGGGAEALGAVPV